MSAQYLKDKAREIAYALFRVSFYVKRADLRNRLDALAVELLESSARTGVDSSVGNINWTLGVISALDSLVRLGHSIYEIEPVNATILVRELDNLNSAIRQFGNSPFGEQLPNLDSLFSSQKNVVQENTSSGASMSSEQVEVPATISNANIELGSYPEKVDLNEFDSFENQESVSKKGGSGINTAIRQAAIINRIKSMPAGRQDAGSGCRLKDLLAEFPDVSERTIRYDLQRLCEQGIIERVGNGGPASYYIFKGVIAPADVSKVESLSVN
jgi:hypothetical protein